MVSVGNLGEYDNHQKWMVLLISVVSVISMVSAIMYCGICNFIMSKITKQKAKASMGSYTSFGGSKASTSQPKLAVKPGGSSPATSSKKAFTIQPLTGGYKHTDQKSVTRDARDLGRVQLHFAYFQSRQALEVTVMCAKSLPAKDLSGTSDPYCKLMLLPARDKKISTKVKYKSLNPVWNEKIQFAVTAAEVTLQTLYVYVLDHDRLNQDDMIGECRVPLRQLNLTRGMNIWKDLHHSKGYASALGQILISLCYIPSQEKLIVNVLKAQQLKAMDANHSSDPYVKIFRIENGVKTEKRRTKTIMKNLNPVFNETFTFSIPIIKVHSTHLLFEVMDYDKLSKNDLIGYVLLGEQKGQGVEQLHWTDMTTKMQQTIAQWHRIRPDANYS